MEVLVKFLNAFVGLNDEISDQRGRTTLVFLILFFFLIMKLLDSFTLLFLTRPILNN